MTQQKQTHESHAVSRLRSYLSHQEGEKEAGTSFAIQTLLRTNRRYGWKLYFWLEFIIRKQFLENDIASRHHVFKDKIDPLDVTYLYSLMTVYTILNYFHFLFNFSVAPTEFWLA